MQFCSMSVVALASVLLAFVASTSAQGAWEDARATFYGTDAWSIMIGSCQYGYLDQNKGTGWNVAAMTSANPKYGGHKGSQCGKCVEVKCRAKDFADGYGQWLERSNVCFNTDSSVVVTITDTCDCNYSSNYYSNKRWCCGDMLHYDLSYWAYIRLADPKWGVIAISARDVPCNYKPRKLAHAPKWIDKKEWINPKPAGWSMSMDRRPM